MTLTFCRDVAAADWLRCSPVPWQQLVTFGPAGFADHARLRFLPDPVRGGLKESDADPGRRADPLPALFEVLAGNTATPDDCFFCVWEGFGQGGANTGYGPAGMPEVYVEGDARPTPDPAARPGSAPAPIGPAEAPLPMVVLPHRAYWLFRGPLADVGGWHGDGWQGGGRLGAQGWQGARGWPGRPGLAGAEPAFVWPADHAWCVAKDVDPHWAGIGGSRDLVDRLIADPRLDAVRADPAADQPRYG